MTLLRIVVTKVFFSTLNTQNLKQIMGKRRVDLMMRNLVIMFEKHTPLVADNFAMFQKCVEYYAVGLTGKYIALLL